MRADTLLLVLSRIASNQARTLNPRQSKRAARAHSALSRLRMDANQSPEIRSTVRRLLAIVRTLSAPARQPAEHRGRGRPRAVTDAEFAAALEAAGGSSGKAAHELKVDRSTVVRWKAKTKTMHKSIYASSLPHAPAVSGE
jgi:hypothetical protein